MRCFLLLTVLLWPSLWLGAAPADAAALFEQGNIHAAQGDWQAARASYEAALTAAASPGLYYNLALACEELADPGAAILAYERALALDPSHSASRHNLHLLRANQNLPASPATELPAYLRVLSPRLWPWLAAAAFWLSLGALLLRRLTRWPYLLPLSALGILLLAGCGLAWMQTHRLFATVVVTAEAPLRVAPTTESPAHFTLRPGEVLRLRQLREDYLLVDSPSGASGYLLPTEAARIWE